MTLLSEINAHPRDSVIRFEEGPHEYYVDGSKIDKSVTSWIHTLFGHFDCEQTWKKYIEPKIHNPSCKYYGMTKEEVFARWKSNGEAASGMGTQLHADIERYWNGLPVDNDSAEYQFFLKFVADYPELVPYRTEWVIYCSELSFAGSIDMVFRAPNKNGDGTQCLEIYDWKRTGDLDKNNTFRKFSPIPCIGHIPDTKFWHYVLQLNLYKYILEKEYGERIQRLVLVRMHPSESEYERVEVPILEDELVDLINYRRLQLGLEADPSLKKNGCRFDDVSQVAIASVLNQRSVQMEQSPNEFLGNIDNLSTVPIEKSNTRMNSNPSIKRTSKCLI